VTGPVSIAAAVAEIDRLTVDRDYWRARADRLAADLTQLIAAIENAIELPSRTPAAVGGCTRQNR